MGAGITNRVLVLADHDTAAHDALDRLKRGRLPDGYRVMHYPELPMLRRYPTLGPQLADPVLMDVNGKAGSLEMYLGRELLTVDGEMVPVLCASPANACREPYYLSSPAGARRSGVSSDTFRYHRRCPPALLELLA